MKKQLTLKQKIVRASRDVKRKLKALKQGAVQSDIAEEKRWKPLLEPLKDLKSVTSTVIDQQKQLKKEPKNENFEKSNQPSFIEDDTGLKMGDEPSWFFGPHSSARVPETPNLTPKLPKTSTALPHVVNPLTFDVEPPSPPEKSTYENQPELPLSQELHASLLDLSKNPIQYMESDDFKSTFDSFSKLHGTLAARYLTKVIMDKDSHDTTFGVTVSPSDGQFRLGSTQIDFDANSSVHLPNTKIFKGTQGLFELLFLAVPDLKLITQEDLQNYKNILLLTNVHRVGFKATGKLRSSRKYKYMKIISPMFKVQKGGRFVRWNDKPYKNVYFHDINQLVKRLELLHSAKLIGNNGVDMEINSIENILRQKRLIV